MVKDAVWATLLTNASYLPGALVLGYSLQLVGSRYPLVVMVTPSVPQDARDVLHRQGIKTRDIAYLTPSQKGPLLSDSDARFADTWTKLRGFELDEYKRVVLLDSDMMIMRNMDELMDLELPADWVAAAHVCACNPNKFPHYPADWIPENCAHTSVKHTDGLTTAPPIEAGKPRPYGLLNSGTVVLTPSKALAATIIEYLHTSPLVETFTFPDQDLLSAVFTGKWKPLPWCYNALKALRVIHSNLWRDDEVRCLHYIFSKKPWHGRTTGDAFQELNDWWWQRFDQLDEEMAAANPEGRKFLRAFVTE